MPRKPKKTREELREERRAKYLNATNVNTSGFPMRVVWYEDYDHVVVKFDPPYEYTVKSSMSAFKKGMIVNPYAPSVCGFGWPGKKYPTCRPDGAHTEDYTRWMNILKRCYDEKHRFKNPAYADATVDDRWRNYENFYEWIHSQENYDAIKDTKYCIDKDILVKGNKLYGPDTCTLVPPRVNNLLLKSEAIRNANCPMGVRYYPRNKKYVAIYGGRKNMTYLGIYPTKEEAFAVYKNYREGVIRKTAQEEYDKGTITKQCYEALINYTIEITD